MYVLHSCLSFLNPKLIHVECQITSAAFPLSQEHQACGICSSASGRLLALHKYFLLDGETLDFNGFLGVREVSARVRAMMVFLLESHKTSCPRMSAPLCRKLPTYLPCPRVCALLSIHESLGMACVRGVSCLSRQIRMLLGGLGAPHACGFIGVAGSPCSS